MSFGSSVGATISFLTARYLLRDFFEDRFAFATARVNRGIDDEGVYYLFGLRLVPLFPFFAINPIMGLTRLPHVDLLLGQPGGHVAGHAALRERGRRGGPHRIPGGLLSPTLVGSFALLAACPLIARHGLAWLRRARAGRDVKPA